MRTRIVTAVAGTALAATMGLAGAVAVPAVAQADPAAGLSGRLSAIKEALAGLVRDGTLTQAQADTVASTLQAARPERGEHGPDGPGVGPKQIADLLGLTPAELRTQLQAGRTLAQVAQAQGVGRQQLVDRLVAAGTSRLAAAVADGRLTQAQADARTQRLQDRVAALVDRAGPLGRPGPGRHSGGGPGGRAHGPGRHDPAVDGPDSDGPDTGGPSAASSPQQAPSSLQATPDSPVAHA